MSDLAELVRPQGIVVLGVFDATGHDIPPLEPDRPTASVAILGQVGSAIWNALQEALERTGPDPLDRFTRRVVGEAAAAIGGRAVYPSDGPPFHPFQRWARLADPEFAPSPIGLLVHPDYGLWTALRAAVLLPDTPSLTARAARPSPCDACATRPCLSTCPVGAFRPGEYRVADCRAFLGTLSGQACMLQGCQARRACPVGREYGYGQAHAAFHMRAFRGAS